MRRVILGCVLAFGVGACSPSFESYVGPSGFDNSASMNPEQREENREAFEELLQMAREDDSDDEPREDDAAVVEVPLHFEQVSVDSNVEVSQSDTIRRSSVDALLTQGPHAVLGVVLAEPYRNGGSLVGYEVSDVYRGGEFVLEGGIERGDVIRSVNGVSIVSPEDVMTMGGTGRGSKTPTPWR